jgi:eukaryotic-like serine/threonine-protein kinase
MDNQLASQLSDAIRGCGLYTSEQVELATSLLGQPHDDATLADRLFAEKILTPYMYRKVRAGRTLEIIFGPYLILDKIGEGGMGKVYRAVQCFAQQMVALKVVRQHLMANKTVKKRYKKEAAAAAALNHPNVVKLFDADEVNGRYFIAMEYVDGIDLARMLKEFGHAPVSGLPSWHEVVEYTRQAALGLQHAHDRGLIHRDIKPSNILVYGERALPGTNGSAHVKILDMGLVRSLVEEEDASRTELTRDGTVVGTPDYMSPEQAKNSSTVDHRADLYSLGCTLFYLLRGGPPFPDGSPIDKLLRHQLDPIPDIRQNRSDIPVALSELIARLMAKRPEDRPQTATEVAEALGHILAGTTKAGPDAEPFSFNDDPNAIYRPESTPLPDSVAMPVPESSQPTTPARSVRLRVASPKSAAQVAVAPKPTKVLAKAFVPRADNAPSSDSLPGNDAIVRTPSRAADSTERAMPRRSQSPKSSQAEKKSWVMISVVICIVGIALLALAVAAAMMLKPSRENGASTSTSMMTPATKTTLPTTPQKSTTPEPKRKLDLADLLPGDTRGFLVIQPKMYWERLAYAKSDDPQTKAHLNLLQKRTLIDPQKIERLTMTFSGSNSETTFVAEGPFLSEDFSSRWGGLPGTKESVSRGLKSWSFGTPFQNLRHGAVLGQSACVISTHKATITELQNRYVEKKPVQIPDDLQRTLWGTNPNDYLFFFAANGRYSLPEGDTLGDHGINFAVIKGKLSAADVSFQLEVVAQNQSRLRDFMSIYLSTRMVEQHPSIKSITELLADAEVREQRNGPFRVKTSILLPFEKAQETLDAMLHPARE